MQHYFLCVPAPLFQDLCDLFLSFISALPLKAEFGKCDTENCYLNCGWVLTSVSFRQLSPKSSGVAAAGSMQHTGWSVSECWQRTRAEKVGSSPSAPWVKLGQQTVILTGQSHSHCRLFIGNHGKNGSCVCCRHGSNCKAQPTGPPRS